jgi:hypothetical protein
MAEPGSAEKQTRPQRGAPNPFFGTPSNSWLAMDEAEAAGVRVVPVVGSGPKR